MLNEHPAQKEHGAPAAGSLARISVVVPVFDERESLEELVDRILAASSENGLDLAEIILVDDGSRDGSWEVMRRLAEEHALVLAIALRRNFGKAMALDAGIRVASGNLIVTMDADLQDDPKELPRFVTTMNEGWDLVSGWKRVRHDPASKRLPSQLFNKVTAWMSGLPLHDFNCGYKAYRREIFDTVMIYGDLHRYVPVLAHDAGYRVTEIEVMHHPRAFGRSKYGVSRLLRGFLDLLTVTTITRFAQRPGHLFGGVGLAAGVLGFMGVGYLVLLKLITGADIGDRPLLLFSVTSIIIGIQFILYGMLAELVNSRMRPASSLSSIRSMVGQPATPDRDDAPRP